MQWISVKDRLPELDPRFQYDSKYCIVATEHVVTTASFREDIVRGKKVKRWHGAYGLFRGIVTHWMPLPEPPKK